MPRPVHRYCRVTRFEFVLRNLMGMSKVPSHVIEHVMYEIGISRIRSPDRVWRHVRSILKSKKWTIYYNRIPSILFSIHGSGDVQKYKYCLRDFYALHSAFDNLYVGRVYFPSMRYIALRLMSKHECLPRGYVIPHALTTRKKRELDVIYDELWEWINKHSDRPWESLFYKMSFQ